MSTRMKRKRERGSLEDLVYASRCVPRDSSLPPLPEDWSIVMGSVVGVEVEGEKVDSVVEFVSDEGWFKVISPVGKEYMGDWMSWNEKGRTWFDPSRPYFSMNELFPLTHKPGCVMGGDHSKSALKVVLYLKKRISRDCINRGCDPRLYKLHWDHKKLYDPEPSLFLSILAPTPSSHNKPLAFVSRSVPYLSDSVLLHLRNVAVRTCLQHTDLFFRLSLPHHLALHTTSLQVSRFGVCFSSEKGDGAFTPLVAPTTSRPDFYSFSSLFPRQGSPAVVVNQGSFGEADVAIIVMRSKANQDLKRRCGKGVSLSTEAAKGYLLRPDWKSLFGDTPHIRLLVSPDSPNHLGCPSPLTEIVYGEKNSPRPIRSEPLLAHLREMAFRSGFRSAPSPPSSLSVLTEVLEATFVEEEDQQGRHSLAIPDEEPDEITSHERIREVCRWISGK